MLYRVSIVVDQVHVFHVLHYLKCCHASIVVLVSLLLLPLKSFYFLEVVLLVLLELFLFFTDLLHLLS